MQCSAEIINYGPIATKLHLAKGTQVPTWLSMKLCGKLNPGETGKLDVIFSPTSIDFTELEQNVETSFNLEASLILFGFFLLYHQPAGVNCKLNWQYSPPIQYHDEQS